MAAARKHFIEQLMEVLGSWVSLSVMGTVTVVWAFYDFHRHHDPQGLDIIISIWTMLLDVFVIIGANYTRRTDRKLLHEMNTRLRSIQKTISEIK